MAQMAFIREIDDKTFLHFSTSVEAFCLRDYTRSANAPPREVLRSKPGGHNTTSITELANQPGNKLLKGGIPEVKFQNSQFWHKYVVDLNKQYLQPKLVFLKEIKADTFLLLSPQVEPFHLRDYSGSAQTPPIKASHPNAGMNNAESIRQLATRPGNKLLDAPDDAPDCEDYQFWHNHVVNLNRQHLQKVQPQPQPQPQPEPPPQPPPVRRLLDRFHHEIAAFIEGRNAHSLRDTLFTWVERFAAIEDKAGCFNHWCNDDSQHLRSPDSGIGWTASLLEYSRREMRPHYIETSSRTLDFTLLSMDLNLGIAAARNLFQPGQEDCIKPDGLAARRDGSAAVLEVKGPRDEADEAGVVRGILQGLCGLLAVYAKREMLTHMAKSSTMRRPAIPQFHVPTDEPSMAVYLLLSDTKYNVGRVAPLRSLSELLFQAFLPLKEIVLFAVNPHDPRFPSFIEYDIAFRRTS
jgi:hypothetical protein